MENASAIDYLSTLKYPLTEKEIKTVEAKKEFYGPRFFEKNRMVEGQIIPLDGLFDRYVSLNPSWLSQFPQLRMQYTLNEDGKSVRRKTKSELLTEFQNQAYLENQDQQLWTLCYQELIKEAEKKELEEEKRKDEQNVGLT